jgi:hypothetical protein
VARIYTQVKVGEHAIPSVFLIKPDRIRYWTKSAAQRDADQLGAEALLATVETLRVAEEGAEA